jgi:hypothetical protein
MRTKSIKPPERTTMRFSQRIRGMLDELASEFPGGMKGVVAALVEKEYRRVKALEKRDAAESTGEER